MNRFLTVGLGVVAGAALFEVALLPAVAIGGAALLAPTYLPKLRRRVEPGSGSLAGPAIEAPTAPPPRQPDDQALAVLQRLGLSQALAKTITFRVRCNHLRLHDKLRGDRQRRRRRRRVDTRARCRPRLLFLHETAWNYFARSDATVALPGRFVVSRRLAKTITFRTIGTAVDFGVNFAGTGEITTAAILTWFGFVVGPLSISATKWPGIT